MKTKTRKTPQIQTVPDTSAAKIALDGDPRVVAQRLVALIPLDDVCGNKALMDAFLSEMFLAVAKASSRKERRQNRQKGLPQPKPAGYSLGRKRRPCLTILTRCVIRARPCPAPEQSERK